MTVAQGDREPLIGLVVEGQTEYQALPAMLSRMGLKCTAPSCFQGQPVEAPIPVLVDRVLLPHVRVQLGRGGDPVIVILDRESRRKSARTLQAEVLRELRKRLRQKEGKKEGEEAAGRIRVVVCDRTFENWIISDPEGLTRSANMNRDLSRQVSCHADERDALSLIKSVFLKGKRYKKAVHGPQLAGYVRVEDSAVCQCSASLCRFLQIASGTSSLA